MTKQVGKNVHRLINTTSVVSIPWQRVWNIRGERERHTHRENIIVTSCDPKITRMALLLFENNTIIANGQIVLRKYI